MAGEIHYQEHTIEEVMDYFIDGFEAPDGKIIRRVTPHYDPRKGSVIFAIYTEDAADFAEIPAQ